MSIVFYVPVPPPVTIIGCTFEPDDTFTGSNGSVPDTDRWTRTIVSSGACNISGNKLYMSSNPYSGWSRLINDAAFGSDLSLQIDCTLGSSTNKESVNFYLQLKNDTNNYWMRLYKYYNLNTGDGTKNIAAIRIDTYNGSTNSKVYVDVDVTYGAMTVKFSRSANALELLVDGGDGGGFTSRYTMTDFGSSYTTFKIEKPVCGFAPNTWYFDNFTVNNGVMLCT
jgi:hypothetical protein